MNSRCFSVRGGTLVAHPSKRCTRDVATGQLQLSDGLNKPLTSATALSISTCGAGWLHCSRAEIADGGNIPVLHGESNSACEPVAIEVCVANREE